MKSGLYQQYVEKSKYSKVFRHVRGDGAYLEVHGDRGDAHF